MNLEEKVQAVMSLFEKLDDDIRHFQNQSSLHCRWGCGKCCFKPDIEATILEFLPLAVHLYRTGKAEEWYDELSESSASICKVLNPTQAGAGLCSQYLHRGLICRLFGYSSRTNKYGEAELVTCQIIKTEQAEAYVKTQSAISRGEATTPVLNQVYMQLCNIDFSLTRDFYPINIAIQKAIETVLQYYAYRDVH